MPIGFEAYARVLHPAVGPPPDRSPLSWQQIGEQLNHTVHPETQWESFEEIAAEIGADPPWDELPVMGGCPSEVIVPLSEHLSRHTSTASAIYYAMWVGFGDLQSVIQKVPQFALSSREYALLTGPITALRSVIDSPYRIHRTPSLSWPADQAWCMATEVDFRWTYVGASEGCISSLEADPRLEVLRTNPEHRGDIESDWPRPPAS